MQIGTKGVKYGLNLPKQKVLPAQQAKKLNVFGGDNDSDEDAPSIGNQIARQAAKKQTDKKVDRWEWSPLCTKARHSLLFRLQQS